MIEELRLDDLITLQRGFDITEKEQIEGDVPVISSGGISSYHNQFKVIAPGVVIGRKGTLGKVFYTADNYWPHDTSLWVKDFKGNDPKFIFYLLQVLHFEKFDAGAANPTLNRNHVHSLKLKVPKRKYRSMIASILSAYDELIEKNKQRIKLLEEMAEEIYKEWFVRMRFPGYESAIYLDAKGNKVLNGTIGALPDGWMKVKLKDYINFEKGIEPGSTNYSEEEIDSNYLPFLRVGDLGARDKSIFVHKDLLKGKIINKEDIVITLDGSVGLVAMNLCGGYSTGLRKITFNSNRVNRAFIYFTLLSQNIQGTIQAHAAGTTILHAGSSINYMEISLPEESIVTKFANIVDSMIKEVLILKDKNQLLQQTRDLLLPKLISGKLSVEHLLEEEENFSIAAEPEILYGHN